MTELSFGEIALDGLWRNNPGLVQLLGLCPLLAVTGTAINGLGLGLATMFTLAVSSVTVSLCRPWLRDEIRIPVFVLIIATVVTTIELIMNAYFHALYTMLGIFIPLIVTNCTIIARAEAFASKTDVRRAFVDALFMGVGFTAVLVVLGGLRELVAHGTVLGDAELLFGAGASGLSWTLIDYRGFLLAALPPGAFIGLGLLVALKNLIDRRLDQRVARRVRAATPVGIGGG